MKKQVKWLALFYLAAVTVLMFFEVLHFKEMDKVRVQIGEGYELISGRDEGLRLELEYRRFQSKVADYVNEQQETSHDDVLTWFDIFWSRVHSINLEATVSDGMDVTIAKALFKDIRQELEIIDPLVQELKPGDRIALEQINDRLKAFDNRVTQLAIAIAQARVERASTLQGKLDLALEGIDTLLITSTGGGVLILTLFGIEAYRARKAERKIKIREARVRFLAEHDPLTRLGNRSYLNLKMKEFIKEANTKGESFHFLLLDLDKFKDVNDTFGHLTGDQLLKNAARRLSGIFRADDIVVRLGGDEFAILMKSDMVNIEKVVNRIISALSSTFVINGLEIHISTSVGISTYPNLSDTGEDLMRDADLALYAAKNAGRNTWAFYEQSMSIEIKHRMGLEADLRSALQSDAGGLEVHYQPQVKFPKSADEEASIIGVEALVRWFHPEHGMIPPIDFINIAENTGIIDELSAWVTRQACEDVVLWHKAGFEISLSVNLSPAQLNNQYLPDEIADVLNETGLAAEHLVLEITESSDVRDTKAAVNMLETLSEQGISLAMDDFGTGYSNLGYLKSLPLDCLKIDRTFVMHIEDNEDDRKLVRGIIHLAQGMGLKVVAEGVETEHQMNFLHSLKCDVGQGYLFGRPVNKLKLLTMLQEQAQLEEQSGCDGIQCIDYHQAMHQAGQKMY
ncbi:MAG: bifunctional diguanylate cyclase/phosphodiesterase [Cohaesibacter sp.]|jgi:diguanylate cyclase (GGDEF)-like protein|nr:bifunctional diguanylate cyclase/phosphodiesterase [Cohaesibacter sp.]